MANKSVGLLTFSFGANMDGFNRAMSKAEKKLTKFGKNLQRTGKSMSLSITLPMIAMGAAAVKFGSDLEETDAKFRTVFSSIEDQAVKTADTLANSFGLSELASKQLLSSTGDLLVGFGFTEASALQLSEQVNRLAIDLASFSNFEGGATGASQALTKALLGETESAKALGIVIRQNTTDYKDRTKEIMATQGVSEIQAKAINNLEIATKQSSKAIGDFNRTSESFANQLRMAKQELIDIASGFGQILIPHVKVALSFFRDLASSFNDLSQDTKEMIVIIAGLAAALGPVLIVIGKMSLGVIALKNAFVALGSFIKANPYIFATTVIVGAVAALSKYMDSLDTTINKTKILSDITAEAEASIAGQLTDIELLVQAINSENVAMDDKIKALNTLKEMYPDFYGEIDQASMSTDLLKRKTDELTKTMMDQAKVEAMRKSITDLTADILRMEAEASAPRARGWEEIAIGNLIGDDTYRARGRTQLTNLFDTSDEQMKKKVKMLQFLKKEYIDLTAAMGDPIQLQTQRVSKVGTTGPNVVDDKLDESTNDELNETIKILKRFYQQSQNLEKQNLLESAITQEEFNKRALEDRLGYLEQVLQVTKDFGEDTTNIEAEVLQTRLDMQGEITESIIKTTEAQKLLNAGSELLGDVLASSLNSALDSQENFFQVFVQNIKKAIRQLLIQLAIMTMIDVLLGGKNLSKALIMGNATKVMGFADGGLVTGPTMGLVGEGSGTTYSNPEVIAPLDKLQQYIGGSNTVQVEGVIRGNDIFIANAKTKFNRRRTS